MLSTGVTPSTAMFRDMAVPCWLRGWQGMGGVQDLSEVNTAGWNQDGARNGECLCSLILHTMLDPIRHVVEDRATLVEDELVVLLAERNRWLLVGSADRRGWLQKPEEWALPRRISKHMRIAK